MKNNLLIVPALLFTLLLAKTVSAQNQILRLVFIRHAEKSENGDNLSCRGFNRSIMLSSLLLKKIGKPDNIYIPALRLGGTTKHLRMLQTVTPFVVKYDLQLNSSYDVDDYKGVAKRLLAEKGTILIVWEHQGIEGILQELGINPGILIWPSKDFDSIWIVTFKDGRARLIKDKEQLNPSPGCPF
jgi:hypothetical protein